MPFSHYLTDGFLEDARKIKETYPEFSNDLKRCRDELSNDPIALAEASLGGGLYKYRIQITGKPSGKSYGARVVYLVVTNDHEIWYLACFDKSELDNLPSEELALLKKLAKKILDLSSKERKSHFGASSLAKNKKRKPNKNT